MDAGSHLFTYQSFVSNKEEIENLLDGVFDDDDEEGLTAKLQANSGVIQKIVAKTLSGNSLNPKEGFHVSLNNGKIVTTTSTPIPDTKAQLSSISTYLLS